MLHELLVFAAVRLSTKRVNCGAFTTVEHPELNAGPVCRFAHFAAQGINLPDQMALAGAADGRVAGHIAHGIQIDGKDNGFQSQACGGQGGFDACMARADDRNVVGLHLIFCHVIHLFLGATPHKCVVGLQPIFSAGNAPNFLAIHKVCLRKLPFSDEKFLAESSPPIYVVLPWGYNTTHCVSCSFYCTMFPWYLPLFFSIFSSAAKGFRLAFVLTL